MNQSTYSWMGTRIHLVIRDDVAAAYNRAQDAFSKAQSDHQDKFGAEWQLNEPIVMDWTEEEQKAFNDVAAVINSMIELNGGGLDVPESECTSDYLVKL